MQFSQPTASHLVYLALGSNLGERAANLRAAVARMAERPFVLVPLAEIAPDLRPPGWPRPVGELAREVRGSGDVLVRKGDLDDATA